MAPSGGYDFKSSSSADGRATAGDFTMGSFNVSSAVKVPTWFWGAIAAAALLWAFKRKG